MRHHYSSKCLHLFYNSYAESVIRYGLQNYGSAAKTNFEKSEKAQRRIWRAFFSKKVEILEETNAKHKVCTVFELYVLEVFNEVVQNLKHESPLDLRKKVDNPCTYATRRTEKRLLPIEFNRTKIKSTSIENIIRKGYNLMKEFDLLPEYLHDLSNNK